MEYPESLYEVINYNNTSILLPKINKKSYSTVLIWLTGMEELSLDYIPMFNYNEKNNHFIQLLKKNLNIEKNINKTNNDKEDIRKEDNNEKDKNEIDISKKRRK